MRKQKPEELARIAEREVSRMLHDAIRELEKAARREPIFDVDWRKEDARPQE